MSWGSTLNLAGSGGGSGIIVLLSDEAADQRSHPLAVQSARHCRIRMSCNKNSIIAKVVSDILFKIVVDTTNYTSDLLF